MITKQTTLPIDAARTAWARIAKGKPDATGMELFREAQRQMDALQMMEQISAGNMANAKAQAIELERVQSINADLLAALLDLRKQLREHVKMDVRKHYGLMVSDAAAGTAIANATGAQS